MNSSRTSPLPALPRGLLWGALTVGVIAISFGSILVRYAQALEVSSLSIATWRVLVASAVVVPWAVTRRWHEIASLRSRDWTLLLSSGVFLALHFATWIESLAHTSVASSVVLVCTGPIFVALGSTVFLRERPGRRAWSGIALAMVGTIVISGLDEALGEQGLIGDLLALAGAVMVAGYLMIGRQVRARVSLITYLAVVYGSAATVLLCVTLIRGEALLGHSLPAYGWLCAAGLVPQLIGHSTLNWALGHLPATQVAMVTVSEPIGAGLLAYFLLGESISSAGVVGAALILLGLWLASR